MKALKRCLLVGSALLTIGAAATGASAQQCERITLIWHAGTCADALMEIAGQYQDVAGVEVVASLVPYGPQWHQRIASEFAAQGDGFDIAAWDSQSVAEFAGGGHAASINELISTSDTLSLDDFTRTALARYGEYPDGSGEFWALPVNQDAFGMMYRRDLFEDPEEQAAFEAQYGYPLAVPQTYQEARDIAEFFTRPDEGLYGWAQYGGREYDFATSSSNSFLWSFGGELWNPETNEVDGYLNAPASVDGVQFYVDMFEFAPPGSTNWGFDEVNSSFGQDQVAMAMQWFYFFGSFAEDDDVGFALLPGAIGRDGQFRRQFSVGGQGLGMNGYGSCTETAWEFIEWYMQAEQQMAYAQTCQTGNRHVLADADWQGLNRFNEQFAVATQYTNDYWHLPEYAVMLDILQEEVTNAIAGSKSVEEALSDAARRHERVLERAGYDITRTADIPEVPDQLVTPVGQGEVDRIVF